LVLEQVVLQFFSEDTNAGVFQKRGVIPGHFVDFNAAQREIG
jgi:hypothetical protein